MPDIFDQLATSQKDAPSGDIFSQLAAQKGGEIRDEEIQNQPEGQLDNGSQGLPDQQVAPVRTQADLQDSVPVWPEDQGQRRRDDQARVSGDIFDQLAKGGGISETPESKQAYAEGGQRPEARKRLSSEVPSRHEEEVGMGGVQPPAQGFGGAALAAGESAARTGIGLAAGKAASTIAGKVLGSVAAALAAPEAAAETVLTGGIGALAVPAIEMGAFAAGSYIGDKATEFVEKLVGVDDAVEKAKAENPEIAKAASIATMVPMGVSSIKNLAKMGVEEATKRVAGGAIGGAAFEPIRYGVESAIQAVTGDETPVSPITFGSEVESALTGGILAAHGYKQIRDTVGPETAKAALKSKTDPAIEAESQQPTPYAPEVRKVEEGDLREYPQGDEARQAAEAGRGYRPTEGGGEPQEVTVPVLGDAAFKTDKGIYRGKNHMEAVDAALQDGAITQEQRDKYGESEKARNTPLFGFIVKTPEGKEAFRDREESTPIGREAGQISEEPVRNKTEQGVELVHSNEVQAPGTFRQLPGAAAKSEFQKNRLVEAANAVYETEKQKGRAVDVGNEGDKRIWMAEMNKRFGSGTLSKEEMDTLWHQSHEAYRIRNASPGRSIPVEKAVDQIEGNRIQSQRAIANNNARINADRAARGLPPIMPEKGTTPDLAWDEASHRIHSDPYYLSGLVQELKTNPNKAVNSVEQAAIAQKIGDLQNQHDILLEQHATATTDAERKAINTQIDNTLADLDFLQKINVRAGTEWSMAGLMRKRFAAADFSLPRMLSQKRKALGRDLTEKERRDVATEHQEIDTKRKAFEEAQDKASTNNQDSDIKSTLDQGKELHQRSRGKKEAMSGDQLVDKYTAEVKARAEDPMGLGSSIRNLGKAIVKRRLEQAETKKGAPLSAEESEAATKVRDVVKDVHDIVSGELGQEWTIKQTRDAISQYGIFHAPSKTALTERVNALIGETRTVAKIEDAVKGFLAKKTGKQFLPPGAGQRLLEKVYNKLVRDKGLKVEDPETQLQGALDTAKKRAENLIAELEQIALRGRKLDERTGKELELNDPDLLDLKGEILGLRRFIEDTYGKKEVPYEQKVAKMESLYDNLITRYQREIAAGEVSRKTSKGEIVTSEKIEHQKQVLENLRSERQAIRDADSFRQEEIKQRNLEKKKAELSKALTDQGLPVKTKGEKLGPESEKVAALQKEVADLQSQVKDAEWFKARQMQNAINAYKVRLAKGIEENKRRLAENDFAPRERKPTPEDEEVRKLKLEYEKAKDDVRQKRQLEEWKNRTPLQKSLDVAYQFKRAAVLSYLSTIEKLGATSVFIPAFRAPAALAGKVIGKLPVFREIAEKSRQEYGGRLDSEAVAYAKHFWEGLKEFKDIGFNQGRSQLDLEFGDGSLIPQGPLSIPGKLHEAIKNPTKRANYKIAYERYLDWAKRQGLNPNDEAVRTQAGIEAYKEANASIFLKDNKLVNIYNLAVTNLRKSEDPKAQAIGFILQENLPIIKIPVNIISEALEYQFGLIPGLSKVIKKKMSAEVGKRLQDITPEEADQIMSQLKKGSVGAMALAIGAALPEFFGGFYRKDSQVEDEEKNFNGITIGGFKIDKRFLHHPAFFPFQIGATMRQIWDENILDAEGLGDKAALLAKGATAASLGLMEELPFLSFSKETGRMLDPTRAPETLGEQVRSNIPGFVQEIAASLDTNESGIAPFAKALFVSKEDVIKRKREGFIDNIKYGLPVFRSDLEEK